MTTSPNWNPDYPRVPIDKNGNWLNYPDWAPMRDGGGWSDIIEPWWAVMKVDGMRTGRSSKIVVLQDTNTGKTHPMFVADLVKGIREGSLDVRSADGEGYLTATWTASKRGQNYGIKPIRNKT